MEEAISLLLVGMLRRTGDGMRMRKSGLHTQAKRYNTSPASVNEDERKCDIVALSPVHPPAPPRLDTIVSDTYTLRFAFDT